MTQDPKQVESEQVQPAPDRARRAWEPMQLHREGRISDLVQGGGGKSGVGGDPGEARKPPGQG
jgi:hypothetical protein